MEPILIESDSLEELLAGWTPVPPLPFDCEIDVIENADNNILGFIIDDLDISVASKNQTVLYSTSFGHQEDISAVLLISNLFKRDIETVSFKISGLPREVKKAINILSGYQIYESRLLL